MKLSRPKIRVFPATRSIHSLHYFWGISMQAPRMHAFRIRIQSLMLLVGMVGMAWALCLSPAMAASPVSYDDDDNEDDDVQAPMIQRARWWSRWRCNDQDQQCNPSRDCVS